MNLNRKMIPRIVRLLALSAFLAACANSGEGEALHDKEPTDMTKQERAELRRQLQGEKQIEAAPENDAPAVTGEVPDAMLDMIMADLEGRSGADRSKFTVMRAESVRWNDGGLGCPEPGAAYTQAIIDGYHVVIEYEGQKNDYRATESGYFKLCTGFKPSR